MANTDHLFSLKTDPVLEDRPIQSESEDKLDRSPFIDGLVRALIFDERGKDDQIIGRKSTNYVVGLTGAWGAGKSSIINLLALKLGTMDGVLVTTLNPWLFRGRDELLSAFFSSLRSMLGKSRREQARDAMNALDRYQEAIGIAAQVAAAYADLHGAGGKATKIVKSTRDKFRSLLKRQRELSPEEERISLERKLASNGRAIVVLIDELDRVDDADVKSVAQLVKAVGDIRGISYLVAYDPERVIDALGRGTGEERVRTGAAYLEKIIQHPVPLRPLFDHDVRALLEHCLRAARAPLPEAGGQNGAEIFDIIVRNISTPREVKRLVGAYSIINRMTREEIYSYDVLAYCWLVTKTPTLRERIVDRIAHLVDDPLGDDDLLTALFEDAQSKDRNPESVLGPIAAEHTRLLRSLFPTLDRNSSKDRRGDRISRRRNLIRLLYLGDPPGSFTRLDIEETLDGGEESSDLRRMLHDGDLPAFLDRIDDDTGTLDQEKSDAFWLGLSDILVREHDWLSEPEQARAIGDEAQDMLLRLGLRGRTGKVRAKRLVEMLLNHGDLVIVPGFLRRHMFQHGLVLNEVARGGSSTLTRSETESLLARELPRYREAVSSGFALRRLPDPEVIFVLKNGGYWDDDLRSSLTEQLVSPEAIQTFAALIVPPGWVTEKRVLDELSDSDEVLKRLLVFQNQNSFSKGEWIQQSIKRLKLTLQGRDPLYPGPDSDEVPDSDEPVTG
jgi:hypothetical protein